MEQLIITAILIIIAVISYVAQAIAKWRQMQEEEARRRQRQARMEAMPQQPQQQRGQRIPQPPQQAAPRPQQKPLEDEISEFLREAARRRSGERPAKPGAPKTPPPPPARERPVVVEVVEPAAPAPLRSKLESQKFPSLQGGLEQRHLHADQEIQSHLQEVFAHSVGSLDTRAVEPVRGEIDESPILAAGRPHLDGLGLAAMFADPASLRLAILAHEIFRRPEERWR